MIENNQFFYTVMNIIFGFFEMLKRAGNLLE